MKFLACKNNDNFFFKSKREPIKFVIDNINFKHFIHNISSIL